MALPERSPYIRILPGASTLDIILKNTHFPDDLLIETAQIQCLVEWLDGIPVLGFQFKSPAYDFSEPLPIDDSKNTEQGWLHQPQITVRLLLADSIIADRMTERVFVLSQGVRGILRMPSGM